VGFFCEEHDIDPYENTELDIGTRDPYAPTDHYEFTGDIPKGGRIMSKITSKISQGKLKISSILSRKERDDAEMA